MKTLIALIIAACPLVAFAGNPCTSAFCRQQVIVQKQVAYPVAAYHAQYLYAPIGYQQQTYRTSGEIAEEAVDRLADKLADVIANRLGIQQQVAPIDPRPSLSKCLKCHGDGKSNEANWHYSATDPLTEVTAAKVGRGLRRGMAQKAGLSAEEQDALFEWYENAVYSHITGE